MNNSGGGEHELATEKGLKMKIKRTKNTGGQGTKTEGTNVSKHEIVKGAQTASNAVTCGNNSSVTLHDSNSNSSSAGSNNSLSTASVAPSVNSTTAVSSAIGTVPTVAVPTTAASIKMATHSPFEKLKQAILEQEKSKQAKQQQQKQDASNKDKVKTESGLRESSGYNMSGASFSRALGVGVTAAEGAAAIMPSGFAASLKQQQQQKNDPYEFNAKNEDRQGNNAALPSAAKKLKTEKDKGCTNSSEMRDAMTDTSHVCVMTDPDCLGPCEPGTSVVLEGIVWQETENGLLVVNVTWRGKTYVGTLLDATKHEWAPPSFRSDSPQDPDARTPRGGRGKRGRTTMNSMGGRGTRTTRNSSSQQSYNPPPSPAKHNSCPLPSAGEKRRPDVTAGPADLASPAKKPRFDLSETAATVKANVLQEWFVCSHPECSKRYKDMHALKFHQNSAHKDLLLQVEQSSEHNKTHVKFAGMQQTTAAQTDEKPKEKRNKKKKNKRNKPEQPMDVDDVNNENVNVCVTVKTEPVESVSNPVTMVHSNSSPEVPRKQAAIPIQVASMTVQQGLPAPNPRTVTAPIVSVPVGLQSSPPGVGRPEGAGGNGAQLTKEEKEKKKEKKKKKKEKKEKKLLEQQQQLQKDGGPQRMGGEMPGGDTKSSPNSGGPNRGLQGMQQRTAGNICDNKSKDAAGIQESVHSPAYSDISDEGNDNVPVLENEVELAKKQSQTIQASGGPKESSSDSSVPKTLQQEPPNLTPVITHTGQHSTKPAGTVGVAPGPNGQQVQQVGFPNNKEMPRPTNLSIRNVAAPQQVNANPEMARTAKESFGGRENLKNQQPGGGSEMNRGSMPPQKQPGQYPIHGGFPPGYNFNPNPGGSNHPKPPNQSPQTQDRLTPQKVFDDKLRRQEQMNQGVPLSVPPKGPSNPGSMMERMERHNELARGRNMDSNMNMPHKLSGSSTNSPQMNRPNNLSNMSPGSDMSKQLPPHSSKSESATKASSAEQQHYKQMPGGMSISERQSENEKILKENLELKTQMNVSDKGGDKVGPAIDPSMRQKDMHRLYLMQHQQAMQQQRHMEYPPPQQQRRFEHPQNNRDNSKVKLDHSSHESGAGSKQQPHPVVSSHSSLPGMSRRENSPMPSPKTKAELKQGADRKDIHPQSYGGGSSSGKPLDHRAMDLQRQMERSGDRMMDSRHGDRNMERPVDRHMDRAIDRERLDNRGGIDRHGDRHGENRNLERPGERRIERLPGDSRHSERPGGERQHMMENSRHGDHGENRHVDRSSSEKRPPMGDSKQELSRKDAPKSPAPAPSMSSPSMSSPAPLPPTAAVPHPASIPHPYPYGYPGYPPNVYQGMPFQLPGYPYMPYPVSGQDGGGGSKALEMLHQASQYYRDHQQVRAQDLRKLPDRKSPNPDGERPKSRNHGGGGPPEKRESPNLSSRPSQLPPPHPHPGWFMHNGGTVPMMQHSPQSSSAKH